MPYKRKPRRRRRRRRKGKSSVGKKLLSDARRRGTNSKLEKAVKLIAKKEALKLLPPNLVFRRFILADYDAGLNEMTNYTGIGWDGTVIALAQIPMTDMQTTSVAALPAQVADGALRPNPTYPYGVNVIAPFVTGIDGYRSGRKVVIKNIAFGLRARHSAQGAAIPRYEHCFLKWAVVTTSDDAQSGVAWEPQPERILRMRTFGYSSRLDIDSALDTSLFKFKTIMRGTIKLDYKVEDVVETQREYFRKVNIPIEYDETDAYGQQVISRRKLFLVLRSNIPQADNGYHPQVGGYFKLGYKNVT